MIKVTFLVDYPETIPMLVQWFRAQWPKYYAERTQMDIAQDFHAEANRNVMPVRLLAFLDRELAGTITLREHANRAVPEYCPGLGGLFVVEQYRGRGIGTELVKAGMQLAQEQGYIKIYTTTLTAQGILNRLGWQLVMPVSQGGEHSMLYTYEFENTTE